MPAPGMSRSAVRPAHATRTPSAVNPYLGGGVGGPAAIKRDRRRRARPPRRRRSWRSPRWCGALTRWRVSPWSGVVAREERVGGDTLGDARQDEGRHHLEGGERVGDDVEGAALRGAAGAGGRARGRWRRTWGSRGRGKGREGQSGRRRARGGERVFRKRGVRAVIGETETRAGTLVERATARRRASSDARDRPTWFGARARRRGVESVGGTGLVVAARTSHRSPPRRNAWEARRRRTRAWAPRVDAPSRAPGATYAAFFSAMHMVFEGLFRRSDDEARGDVGLGCG